jgi:hypothetical protein
VDARCIEGAPTDWWQGVKIKTLPIPTPQLCARARSPTSQYCLLSLLVSLTHSDISFANLSLS